MENPAHGPLQILGRGTASTVYNMPSDPCSPAKKLCLKTGHDSTLLQQEFEQARNIFRLYGRLSNSTLFLSECGDIKLPHMPLHREFRPKEDTHFWGHIKGGMETQGDLVSGIVMERIPSMPPAVGKMLIRRYFDQDEVEASIRQGDHQDFLIQLLFGRSQPGFNTAPLRTHPLRSSTTISIQKSIILGPEGSIITTTASSRTTSTTYLHGPMVKDMLSPSLPILNSLADLPVPLPLIKSEIPTRAWKLVSSIAAGYAMMHWGCHVDGAGTEFVLAGGEGVKVWMLDFDKCRDIDFPTESDLQKTIRHRIIPVLVDGGYVPKMGEEEEEDDPNPYATSKKSRRFDDETLWETWRNTYISVGKFCAKYVGRIDLAQGPEMACDAVEIAVSQERMGLSDDDSMIVFEADGENGQDDQGWGSDDEYDDDSDDSDEDDSVDEEDENGEGEEDGDEKQDDPYDSGEDDDAIYVPPTETASISSQRDGSTAVTSPTWENGTAKDLSEVPMDTPDDSSSEADDDSDTIRSFAGGNYNDMCPTGHSDAKEAPMAPSQDREMPDTTRTSQDEWQEGLTLPDPLDPEELIPPRFSTTDVSAHESLFYFYGREHY